MDAMTGENGIVQIILSGTTYTALDGVTEVDPDLSRDFYPTTVQGDQSKSYAVSLPDFACDFTVLISATDQTPFIISDGTARTATIKLDRSAPSTASHQFRGPMFFTIKGKQPVLGLIEYTLSAKAQSPGVKYYFADGT